VVVEAVEVEQVLLLEVMVVILIRMVEIQVE